VVFHGTLRVDTRAGQTTISGDLYRFWNFPWFNPTLKPIGVLRPQRPLTLIPGPDRASPGSASAAAAAVVGDQISPFDVPLFDIPIYARNRYYSYLKVKSIQRSAPFGSGPCQLTFTTEEYLYTQPPAGQFDGTFPLPPGSRTVTITLETRPAPAGFGGAYFEGTLSEGGVAQGTVTMGWVSPSFRRATLEIDTLTGAVAPQAVGTENFGTVFASAGWDMTFVYDQTNIPVPAGVTATACWSNANLHALMLANRNPATNLDAEWRLHLFVVPAAMNCGRGVMYDTIDVPREGVASFSNDGYPVAQSSFFGSAAGQQQRNVPRAFLRSASHETGHGFNQIHQEQEAGADNSIMTTTPSVADVLAGPATGAPGVFPDQINLGFNEHVRHHLVHFPDPVVRPGGMTFGAGHSFSVPEADRYYFSPTEVDLQLVPDFGGQIELGEPLLLRWQLVNNTAGPIPVPQDIGVEAQHTFITVTNPHGAAKLMPSFVIQTDRGGIRTLDPGDTIGAETRVYWGSRGFAFETPGKYGLELRILWTYRGAPFGVTAHADVWVNYPRSQTDNDAAATLLHPEVGKYVALGGGAMHLTEAVRRLDQVFGAPRRADAGGAPAALRGYRDLLPTARQRQTVRAAATPTRSDTRRRPTKTTARTARTRKRR
jgi:hypothetical protein